MVSLKLDKYKLWGLITVSVTWVLYMVAMGTAWYQVRKSPVENSTGSDGLTFAVKFKIMSLTYDMTDAYGNSQHTSVAWGVWNLVWTRSILSGAYAFGALCFIFQTVILVILILHILDKGSAVFGKAVKGLAIALAVFNTLAILIFPGITLAFQRDQNNAAAGDANKIFWPCTNLCTASFAGIQSDSTDSYLWAPDAGWPVMIIAWPIMVAAVYLLLKKINFTEGGSSSSPSSSSQKGVAIELPQSN